MRHPDKLRSAGVTIASVWYDAMADTGDVEGLLFGRTVTTTRQQLQDGVVTPHIHTETVSLLRGTTKTGPVGSFYDMRTGAVCPETLEQICRAHLDQGQFLLGWYKFRLGAPLRPSMMELAVTHSLGQWGQSQGYFYTDAPGQGGEGGAESGMAAPEAQEDPMVMFATFTHAATEENKATLAFEYSFFPVQTKKRMYVPIRVEIVNLQHGSQQEYLEVQPLSCLPFSGSSARPSPLEASLAPRGPIGEPNFVTAVREGIRSSLNDMEALAKVVAEEEAQIRLLTREIRVLQQQQQQQQQQQLLAQQQQKQKQQQSQQSSSSAASIRHPASNADSEAPTCGDGNEE